MEKQDILKELKDIALKAGLDTDIQDDKGVLIVGLLGGTVDLYVWANRRQDGLYYANSLESSNLPREFYFSSKENNFSLEQEAQRSKEVVENARGLIFKKLSFHPSPGILNKKRGYITLPVDGKPTRLYQKYNAFGLPLA